MWRDVTRCASIGFISTFNALESENLLDPLNEVDIFCLHYIFIPHVNKCLTDFQGSWNRHGLSTEGNMSPLQLFVEGLSQIEDSPVAEQNSTPGASSNVPNNLESVQVPSNKFEPCSGLSAELVSVDPMAQCTDFGKEFYCRAIQIAGRHLQMTCNNCKLE